MSLNIFEHLPECFNQNSLHVLDDLICTERRQMEFISKIFIQSIVQLNIHHVLQGPLRQWTDRRLPR